MDILDIESFGDDGPVYKWSSWTPDPNATITEYTFKPKLTWRGFLRALFRHPGWAIRWLLQKKVQTLSVPGERIHVGFQPDMILFRSDPSE